MAATVAGTPQKLAWDDNTSSKTMAIDCTGANGLVVAVGWADPSPPSISLSAFTYNAVAMTRLGTVFTSNTGSGAPGQRIDYFYLVNPASGSHNFSVTSSASMGLGTGAVIVGWALAGVDTTTMMGTTGNGGDVGVDAVAPFSAASATLTTVSGDMVLDFAMIAGTGSITSLTANGGQTSSPGTQTTADAATYAGASYKSAAGTSTNTGWTYAPSATRNAIYRAVRVNAGSGGGGAAVKARGFGGGTQDMNGGMSS